MRRIDESERPMPEINPAKVCFVIEKSRELLSEDLGGEPDASEAADGDEGVTLTDEAGGSVRRELVEFLKDLDVDESAALVALAWIGRGDFEPEDWKSAVAQASERAFGPTWKYLLGISLLPDYLEDALSSFGRSCEAFEVRDGGGRVAPDSCSAGGGVWRACVAPGAETCLAIAPASRHFCPARRSETVMSIDHKPAPFHRSLAARLRSWFFTGLIVFGPVAATAYIALWIANTIDNWVQPWLPRSLSPDDYLPFHVPGFGVVIALIGLTLLGFLTANIVGRSLVRLSEAMLDRTPLVRGVYKGLKQIFETVFSQSGSQFRKVGLVEFPIKGSWSIVFVSSAPGEIVSSVLPGDKPMTSVFLPCTPNPTTGFYFFVPADDVIELPISPDEAAKLIMSAGLIQPEAHSGLSALAVAAKLEKLQAETHAVAGRQ